MHNDICRDVATDRWKILCFQNFNCPVNLEYCKMVTKCLKAIQLRCGISVVKNPTNQQKKQRQKNFGLIEGQKSYSLLVHCSIKNFSYTWPDWFMFPYFVRVKTSPFTLFPLLRKWYYFYIGRWLVIYWENTTGTIFRRAGFRTQIKIIHVVQQATGDNRGNTTVQTKALIRQYMTFCSLSPFLSPILLFIVKLCLFLFT